MPIVFFLSMFIAIAAVSELFFFLSFGKWFFWRFFFLSQHWPDTFVVLHTHTHITVFYGCHFVVLFDACILAHLITFTVLPVQTNWLCSCYRQQTMQFLSHTCQPIFPAALFRFESTFCSLWVWMSTSSKAQYVFALLCSVNCLSSVSVMTIKLKQNFKYNRLIALKFCSASVDNTD